RSRWSGSASRAETRYAQPLGASRSPSGQSARRSFVTATLNRCAARTWRESPSSSLTARSLQYGRGNQEEENDQQGWQTRTCPLDRGGDGADRRARELRKRPR